MVMRTGERWHCIAPECGCSVNVTADGHIPGENPRCACGGELKKTYSPPTLTYLEFLSIAQPASVRRDFEEE
jgi:hypothetical protein